MKYIAFLIVSLLITTYASAEKLIIPLSTKYDLSEKSAKLYGGLTYSKGVVGGVKYHRYDSAAHFDNTSGKVDEKNNLDWWVVRCEVDEMTDETTCSVVHNKSSLFIWMKEGKGISTVTLFEHDFPGKTLAIRVGDSKPVRSNRITGQRAKELIAQMKPGVVVKTRYYKWPYESGEDKKVTIGGRSLMEAIKYANWILSGKYKTKGQSSAKPNNPPEAANNSPSFHIHGERSHSHPLPTQGKAHKHGTGPIGR